jgi:DNA polymerase-1
VVAIDIETKEEKEISKYGPGSHRHYLEGEDSYILGVAFSDISEDFYYPASDELFDWLREVQDDYLWVGHNLLYDLSWLRYEGFRPKRVADTFGLFRLLSEDRMKYSLDSIAKDYLYYRKNESEIKAWCQDQGLKGSPQKWLWKMPTDMVARYAKIDTRLVYDLYTQFIDNIEEQALDRVWDMECELLPILSEMHHRGIRIDETRRQQASENLGHEVEELAAWMYQKAGREFNTNSSKQKAEVFDELGLKYSYTDKGNPSFKADEQLPYGVEPDMEYLPHVIVVHNKLLKLKRDFVDRLEDFMVRGRIHPMVNPYGTKTGRPSCATPNIFQIPKRGRGKDICRVLFLPEEGEDWVSMDYASEEYRVFAHYAVGQGADRYRHKYNTEDDYDMHTENAKLAGVDRTKAKTIGLGVLFGMGKNKMAANLGVGQSDGLQIVDRFHNANPAFKATARFVETRAKRRGYIFTQLGRRRRLDEDTAYTGLNFLTQGNSADLAKATIVEAYKRGLLEKVNIMLYLYDEYDLSVSPENRKYAEEFKKIGETAIKFRVKMVLDVEYGPNWGETYAKEDS